MILLKHFFCALITLLASPHIHASINQDDEIACLKKQIALDAQKTLVSFKPDIHITEPLLQDFKLIEKIRQLFFETQDLKFIEKIKQLFFETDSSAKPKQDVYQKAVHEFGGQEVMLLTDDNVRISALYFKRTNAPLSIIYIPGYFFDLTPTKEWGAPFSLIFEKFNILIIDWRGTGASEGKTGFWHSIFHGNPFGTNAYPDVQAAVDFMTKESNKPIILVGFCFGATMALLTTIQAQKTNKPTADALVLDCASPTFEKIISQTAIAEHRFFQHFLIQNGLARPFVDQLANGSLMGANAIDLIKDVHLPCYFEHFTYDPFATLHDGISVYQAAPGQKMFMASDVGKHVGIHTKVPYQYHQSFIQFLKKFEFLPHDWQSEIDDFIQLPVAAA